MPLREGKDYYQFGPGGKKYFFKTEIGKKRAKTKALRQGRAMAVSKYGGGLDKIILSKSSRKDKKYMVKLNNKTIHFGAKGYEDYTTHKDRKRKRSYEGRHREAENWTKSGIDTAGFWAKHLLWNKPTIEDSIKDIEDNFNVDIQYMDGGFIDQLILEELEGLGYTNISQIARDGRGGDIVKIINKLFPKTEFHTVDQADDGKVRKASFCGPGTQLNRRLENYDSENRTYSKVNTPPINKMDRGCLEHDLDYGKYKDLKNRHASDERLIKVAEEVLKDPKSTAIQKANAFTIKNILKAKVAFGGDLDEYHRWRYHLLSVL